MIPDKQHLREVSRRLRNWSEKRATEAFARLHRTTIENISNFDLADGKSVRVYWYSKDSPVLGQLTPVGTILLNRSYMERLSQHGQNLVIRHELGHANRRPSFRGVFWGMVGIGVLGITSLLISGGLLALGQGWSTVANLSSFGVLGTSAFLLTNRVEETTADLHALRHLGEETYLEAHREIEETAPYEPTIVGKVWKKISYTRPETIVRINQLLSRITGSLDK